MTIQSLPVGILGSVGGGVAYNPGMMNYDGSTGFYSKTVVTAGNKATVIVRFNASSFTGDEARTLCQIDDGSGNAHLRMELYLYSSNWTGLDAYWNKLQMTIENSANTRICRLISINEFTGNGDHIVMASFDGDLGIASLIVDEVDEDDTGHIGRTAPTSGTLGTGASSRISYGAYINASGFITPRMGYTAYIEDYLTNASDFMDGNTPLELDTSGWTEFGSQPEVFADDGKLDTNNLGSYGALTKNGTITGPT